MNARPPKMRVGPSRSKAVVGLSIIVFLVLNSSSHHL